MRTTEKTFRVEFRSAATSEPADAWVARIHFPPHSGPDDNLPIEATDGLEHPIEDGEFEVMGQKCKIKSGSGSMRYSDFIAGIHEKPVCMHRPGMTSIPGSLTFA